MGIGDYRQGEHDLFFPNIEDDSVDSPSDVDSVGTGSGQDVGALSPLEERPLRMKVTDPEHDAPDGAEVFFEDYNAWYRRSGDYWNFTR